MITTKEVRERLGLPPEQDAKAELFARSAIAGFERLTCRLWNYRETYDTTITCDSRTNYIWSPLAPIAEGDSENPGYELSEYGVDKASKVEIDPLSLAVNLKTGMIERLDDYFDHHVILTLNKCGLTAEACSRDYPDIKEALLFQCEFVLARNAKEKLILESTSFQGSTTKFIAGGFHPIFKEVTQQYRRR